MPELYFLSAQELCPEQPWLLPLFFALFGACIGSFLNVVIYRLPRGLSVSEPRRSFCPTCKKPIPWYLNIPVFSWLMLRGRSACCGTRITARYCLVEALCALLFAALAYEFAYIPPVALIALCAWTSLMLCCFFIDWEEMIVLPKLAVSAALCAAVAVVAEPSLVDGVALEPSEGLMGALMGAAGGFALFKLVALLGRLLFGCRRKSFESPQRWTLQQAADDEDIELIFEQGEKLLWSEVFLEERNRLYLCAATLEGRDDSPAELCFSHEQLEQAGERPPLPLESVEKLSGQCSGYRLRREAMGSGDAWLALAIGALCGWQGVVFALVVGSFIGLGAAAAQRIGFGRPLPFGPSLIAASLIRLFFGNALLEFYLETAGLM